MKENSSVACLREQTLIVDDEDETILHISRETIVKLSTIYVIRPDWPLERRVNKILQAMVESDIISHGIMADYQKSSEILAYEQKLKNNEKYRVNTLADLTFAFVILGFGLGCATASFIVEITIG